jgi:hypothetical protein
MAELGGLTSAGRYRVTYTGYALPQDTALVKCSACHAAIPRDAFTGHVEWHGTILHASPEAKAAARRPDDDPR